MIIIILTVSYSLYRINDIENENLSNDENNSQDADDIADYVAPPEGREDTEPVEDTTRIEDLPLDKRIQIVKNCHNPYGTIKPGLWVDAIDSVNSWLSATIEEVENNSVRVHFEGWPSKWDDWYRITSYKICPFRKQTCGYTGQLRIALRKTELPVEELQKMIEKIDICIKNNLKGLGAVDTTQFYRGDVFFALDNIFQRTYEPNEAELFEVGIEFVKKVLELIVTYLKLVPDMLVAFNEERQEPDLYIVDENIAVTKCLPEFTEILKTIFCLNPRCLRYYLKYDRAPAELKTDVCKPFQERDFEMQRMKMEDLQFDEARELMMKPDELDFGLFYEFLDYFQQLEGFDALTKALKCVVPFEDRATLPLELIPQLTTPYKNCAGVLNPEYTKKMCEELQSVIIGRLENMTDDEMKDIDKTVTNNIVDELREFLYLGIDPNIVDEKLESIKLSMALRFLKSTNMKKRLNGINEVKHIIEMTSGFMRPGIPQDFDSPRRARWLKPEYLCKWIKDNDLIEYLLGETSHIEVIKRSTTVLKFLTHYKQLTKEHLDLLWKCQEDKHEATVLGIYETIIDLSIDLDKDALDYIFKKIESIPLKKYNEQTVNFVKDFTLNACRSSKPSNARELVDLSSDDEEEEKNNEFYLQNAKEIIEGKVDPPQTDVGEYGIPILYELMKQPNELGSCALKAILEVLRYKYLDLYKMKYILNCIKNLQDGKHTHQSLTVITTILPKCFTSKSFERRSQLQVALLRLNDIFDMVSLTIQNIERYNNLVQKSMVDSIDKGVVPENIAKTCFEGNVTHSDYLDKLLEFLEFIIIHTYSDINIGTENLKRLWEMFVNNSSIEFDKTLFFKWLNKEKFNKTSVIPNSVGRSIFSVRERQFLFSEILCKPDYVDRKEISYNCYKCFEKYFAFENRQSKVMLYSNGSYRVYEFENIKGLESLWDISLLAKDPKVTEEGLILLAILHLNLEDHYYDQEKKRAIWEIFINKCVDTLKSDDNTKVNSAILALIKFFNIYEGRDIISTEVNPSSCFGVAVYSADDSSKKTVNIPYGQTVEYLRKMIAEAFDLSVNEFLLYVNKKLLSAEDDDTFIRDIGFTTMYYIRKIQDDSTSFHPKNLLAGNQEFFNMLFDLLSNDEDHDVENIWKLLMKLPQDENPTAKKLEKLEVESDDQWEELIDGSSIHKLLYSLQIVSKKVQNDTEWQNQFLVMRGYHHLFKVFLQIDSSKVNSSLAFKGVDILCRIVCESMQENPELMVSFKEHSLEAISQLIKLIHQVTKLSLIDLKKRGVTYDELYYKNKKSEQKNFRMLSYYGDKSKSDNDQEEQNQYTRQVSSLVSKFEHTGKFVSLSFRLLFHFEAYSNEECINQMNSYPHLGELLQNTLIDTDNFNLRDQFGDGLIDILCNQHHDFEKFLEFKKNVLNIIIFDLSNKYGENPVRAYKCTEIITKILSTTPNESLSKMDIDFEAVLDMNVKTIMNKETSEKSSTDYDNVLSGAFKIVKNIIQQYPYLKEKYGEILLTFLLKDCLFEVPRSHRNRHKVRPPKCKNPSTRGDVFRLINVLSRDSLENTEKVLNFIKVLQAKSSWRTRKHSDWIISPYTDEKSTTGFVGIKNLGCICYMIALLQQLYMIPTFRDSILAIDDPKKEEVPKEDNLLYQLQCIFASLHQSEQQYYNPQGFTNAFKDWDGNPTNVLIQMDVDEFFNMFMDKLEFAIKSSPQEKVIQDHFGGTYANELICKGCPHYSERSEPYLAVNLQVKNKKSIKDSLDSLIEGEMLDGDNSYYCEKCDKKVPTLKRTCIKRLPKHLILVLKRFEFDYDIMQKMKVNDYCEFPEELNMEPYTQEGLARREKIAKKEEKGDDDDEEEVDTGPKYPIELYNYRLSGVLVHSGYAEGGHYYSFIKDREDEESKDDWYEFNDELVKEFDKEDLESECFGGEEKWNDFMGQSVYLKNSEKHRNAYVLFYDRISEEEIPYSDDENEEAQPQKETLGDGSDIPMASENDESNVKDPVLKRTQTLKVPDEIEEMIEEENRKYWQYKFMFSHEYSEFILELCSLWNTKHMVLLNYDTRNRDYHILGIDEDSYKEELKNVPNNVSLHYSPNKNIKFYPEKYLLPSESVDVYQKYGGEKVDAFEFEIFKLITTFYLNVKQRASIKEGIPDILDLIKAHLNKSLKACKWLITQFSNSDVLAENLLQCTIPDMRKLSAGLIYCAMVRIYDEEKEHLNTYWQYKEGQKESYNRCYLGNFINLVLNNLKTARTFTEYNPQFTSLISKFANLGQEARLYLFKCKIVGRILNYYLQGSSPYQEYFEDTSDLTYEENENVELGLPAKLEQVKMSIWDELFMKKRDDQIANANQDYTYLWETLSLQLRSCVLTTEDAPTFIDDLRYKDLDEKELTLLKMDEKDLMAFLMTGTTKCAAKHLSSLMMHMCHKNPEFDNMLRNVLILGITDKQLEELKTFFPTFKKYLFIQDEHSEERVAESIVEYFGVLHNNSKYAPFMAKFTSFLVKLCNIHRGVAEFMASCPEKWEWVIDWINKTPCPTKSNHQLKNYTRETAISQYKLKRLEDIRNGNIVTYEDEYDSDDDMADQKFYKDKKIDYRHALNTWVTAEVMISLDEMDQIHYIVYNQAKAPWINVEDDNIAPHNAMQSRHDTIAIDNLKQELEKQYRLTLQNQHQEESASHQVMSESAGYSNEGVENGSVSDD